MCVCVCLLIRAFKYRAAAGIHKEWMGHEEWSRQGWSGQVWRNNADICTYIFPKYASSIRVLISI